MKHYSIIAICLALCGLKEIEQSNPPAQLSQRFQSMYNVIANAESFHGEKITIAGRLSWDGTEQAIYTSSEMFLHGSAENALWLHSELPPLISVDELKHLNGSWVRVSGILDVTLTGDKDMYNGTVRIQSIQKLAAIKSRVSNYKKEQEDGVE